MFYRIYVTNVNLLIEHIDFHWSIFKMSVNDYIFKMKHSFKENNQSNNLQVFSMSETLGEKTRQSTCTLL